MIPFPLVSRLTLATLLLTLAAPVLAQSQPLYPVGGGPILTLTLDDGSAVTGAVLAVNADIYLISVDGRVTSVARARVTSVTAEPAPPPTPPLEPAPDPMIPEVGPPPAGPPPTDPPELLPPPYHPVTAPPRWNTGTGMVIAGSAAAAGGLVAHTIVGPAEDGRFWASPVTGFAVFTELGGATAVLAGAGAQRRALRESGERVNAAALVGGWIGYGLGTAWLTGALLTGNEPEIINPGSALVGTGLVLGVVQARVNAGAVRW